MSRRSQHHLRTARRGARLVLCSRRAASPAAYGRFNLNTAKLGGPQAAARRAGAAPQSFYWGGSHFSIGASDWDSCRFWIDKAKAGARAQPITIALRDALRRRQGMLDDPEGWIFPSRTRSAKTPYRPSFAKSFRRAVIRAKLPASGPKAVTPHIMRHTGISRFMMAGTDLKTAQTISGHETVAMLMHYAYVFAPHVDNAMNVLERPIPDTVTQELHTARGEVVKLDQLGREESRDRSVA